MKTYPCSCGVAGNRPALVWLVGLMGIFVFGSSGVAGEVVEERGVPERESGVRVLLELGELDREAEGDLLKKRLQAAVHLLTRRAERGGLDGTVVELLDSGVIELAVPGVDWEGEPDLPEGFLAPTGIGFHLVHREKVPATTPDDERPDGYREMALDRTLSSGEVREYFYFVREEPEMAGALFRDAYAVESFQGDRYEVMLTFSEKDVGRFGDLTREIERENESHGTIGQLAIVFDGLLYSAPTVRQEIRSETIQVTGRFSREEAGEIALLLGYPLESRLVVAEVSEAGGSASDPVDE